MPHKQIVNRRIVLAARPEGMPAETDFRMEETPIPEPDDGQVLLRTHFLSLDPYMRSLMNVEGASYAPAVALGATMPGGTVCRVVNSRYAQLNTGDWVLGNSGWQEYAVADGSDVALLDDTSTRPSLALGGMGMPGFTAYVGLLDIGQPQPGQTVVVAAATGAVGSVVVQLATLKSARAIGVAGGAENAAVQSMSWASMRVSTVTIPISPTAWPRHARTVSTCISRMSVVLSSTPCCHC